MDPYSVALMGGGLVLGAYGDFISSQAQAAEEAKNASFYREQAAYAKASGIRQRDIFNRQSKIIAGQQTAQFAKSGGNLGASSFFMATQSLFRQQEEGAIQAETEFNVRLAMLRAEHSDAQAAAIGSKRNFWIRTIGSGLKGAGSIV